MDCFLRFAVPRRTLDFQQDLSSCSPSEKIRLEYAHLRSLLDEIVQSVNEHVRTADNQHAILLVQRSLISASENGKPVQLLQPSRRYIHEGELEVCLYFLGEHNDVIGGFIEFISQSQTHEIHQKSRNPFCIFNKWKPFSALCSYAFLFSDLLVLTLTRLDIPAERRHYRYCFSIPLRDACVMIQTGTMPLSLSL